MRKLHKQAEKPTTVPAGFRLARVGTKKAILGWIEIPQYESVDSYIKEYGPAQAKAMIERGQAIYEQSLFRPGKPMSEKRRAELDRKAVTDKIAAGLHGKPDSEIAAAAKRLNLTVDELRILMS